MYTCKNSYNFYTKRYQIMKWKIQIIKRESRNNEKETFYTFSLFPHWTKMKFNMVGSSGRFVRRFRAVVVSGRVIIARSWADDTRVYGRAGLRALTE